MKKTTLLKSVLLLCTLVAGSVNGWATTATLTITSKPANKSDNLTDDKSNTWAFTSDANTAGSEITLIHVGTNSSAAQYIKLTTSAYATKRITKIQVWAAAKASTNVTTKIKIGSNLLGTSSVLGNTTSSGGTEFSVNVTDKVAGNIEIEISRPSSANGAIYFVKAIVTYQDYDVISISDKGYATFSSPFEVQIPTGVTAYYAQQKDANTITLKQITGGYIPANTGVVVAGDEDDYNASITSTSATLAGTNLLQPWLKAGTPTAGTYYILGVNAGNPVFKLSSGSGTLAAGKAYLTLPAGANELNIDFDNEESGATGIADVNGKISEKKGDCFNLNGQRVDANHKGIVIVSGKKIVNK